MFNPLRSRSYGYATRRFPENRKRVHTGTRRQILSRPFTRAMAWVPEETVCVRYRSHLVPGQGTRVRYSLGTNVNTPFFHANNYARVRASCRCSSTRSRPCNSGTKVGTRSLCARRFCYSVPRQSISLFSIGAKLMVERTTIVFHKQ